MKAILAEDKNELQEMLQRESARHWVAQFNTLKCQDGSSFFCFLVKNKQWDATEFLLNNCRQIELLHAHQIDTLNRHGSLHAVVNEGKKELVKFFLRSGCNINNYDKNYNTALHCAVMSNRVAIGETLLIYGADMYIKNKDGLCPFELDGGKEMLIDLYGDPLIGCQSA